MEMPQRYLHELLFLFRCNVLRIHLWIFVSISLVSSTYYVSKEAHKDLTSSSSSILYVNAKSTIHCASYCELDAACISYSFNPQRTIASCILYASATLTFDVPEPGRQHFKKSEYKPIESTPKECQSGWKPHGRNCYFIETQTELNWQEASSQCSTWNSRLTVPLNASENEFVKGLARAKGEDVWLGITDSQNEGIWIDHVSMKTLDFTDWAPNEPNNDFFVEHCGMMYGPNNYEWNDKSCTDRRGFICEYQL